MITDYQFFNNNISTLDTRFVSLLDDLHQNKSIYALTITSNFSLNQALPFDYLKKVVHDLDKIGFLCDLDSILSQLVLLSVPFVPFDAAGTAADLHRLCIGQIVVNQCVAEDVISFFALALTLKFPIGAVLPLSHPQFIGNNGLWNDDLSMAYNNSSGFHLRKILDKPLLSLHSYGLAIDINPLQNPCIYTLDNRKEPPNSIYRPDFPGTFGLCDQTNSAGKELTQLLISKGWTWGRDLSQKEDYHHFQKAKNSCK